MTTTPEQVRAAAVRTVAATARLDNHAHDPVAVSIDREIATQLPEGIAGGGGIVKATASLELDDPVTPDQSVLTRRIGPWTPAPNWPPSRSEDATVDIGVDSDMSLRRFTGRVAEVQGSVLDTTVVKIEDRTDDFKIDFSHDAMLRTMPPVGDSAGDMLQVGLRADWIADKVMRRAGWYTTPRVMGTGVVTVPAQGSMWPSYGTCRTCTNTAGDGQPSFNRAEWGLAVADVSATYGPRDLGAENALRGRAIAQGMMIGLEHDGIARMDTAFGAASLTLRVLATRRVEALFNGTAVAAASPSGDWTRVEAIWRADGTLRVHTDTGWSSEYTWSPGSVVLDSPVGRTDITVNPGGRAAGFIVQYVLATYTGGYTGQELNATIVPGPLLSDGMRAMPSLTSRDGLNLLQEISESLAISMWIDEDGHLWWVHPDRMRDQAPVADLTATYDLLDLTWEDTANLARRSVTVTYMDPTIRRRRRYRLKAWEGGGENLEQGESSEEIITPEADRDWIEVDEPKGGGHAIYATPYPSNVGGLPDFNRGIGSWFGGTHLDANGDSPQTKLADWDSADGVPPWIEDHNDDFPNLIRSLTKIGPAAWKLSVGLEDTPSNYWPDFQQALDPVHDGEAGVAGAGSDINMSWTGQKLPIIRCKAITDWADAEYTSSITGPNQYEEFVHDTGPWAGDSVKALTDWFAEQVTKPMPLVRDFPIHYRTDIRLGNVITITEDVVYRVRLRVLVIGISEKHSEGDSSLTITGRVITATALAWTYDQLQAWAAAQGMDYDGLEARDGTYAELSIPPESLTAVLDGEVHRPDVQPAPIPGITQPDLDTTTGIIPPTLDVTGPDRQTVTQDGRWRWPAPSDVPPVDVGPDITPPDIDVTPPDEETTT